MRGVDGSVNVLKIDRVVAEFRSIRGGSRRQRGWGEERLRSHGLIGSILGMGLWGLVLRDCLSKRNRLWFLMNLSVPAPLVQENLDVFRSPPWVVCWGNSSSTNWGIFSNSAEESPGVEIAHFIRVGGVDSVLGRDKEPMTTSLGVESSHDAQKDEVPFA